MGSGDSFIIAPTSVYVSVSLCTRHYLCVYVIIRGVYVIMFVLTSSCLGSRHLCYVMIFRWNSRSRTPYQTLKQCPRIAWRGVQIYIRIPLSPVFIRAVEFGSSMSLLIHNIPQNDPHSRPTLQGRRCLCCYLLPHISGLTPHVNCA